MKARLRFRNCVYLTCIASALSLVMCLPSYGQVVGATLNGTVTDSSKSIVPNVKISIINANTGVSRDTTTDAAGFYTVPNLVPGVYEITASATGFATKTESGITLAVGAEQVLDISLEVGTVSQKVQVTGEAPVVELSSSAITNEVDETTIRELPLNGRNWTQLAALQPGVASLSSIQPTIGQGFANQRGNRGFGSQLTISGGRPSQNNYRVDGISVNDYTNGSPGDPFGVALGVDAIAEFSVVSSNYSAEYGRTSGGVINAVTRSGTNGFHGSAYEFLRNSALDARNYFDGASIPPFRRNQFGATAGGPIKKDKTFFFADYEGLRQDLNVTSTGVTVPSPAARQGIIQNQNGTTTHLTVNPSVAPFLAIYPTPTTLVGLGNTGIFSFVAQQIGSENFGSTRVDHHFSASDSLFGVYQIARSQVTLPDSLNTVLSGQDTASQHIAVEESHTFSSRLVNVVRFGYNRVNDLAGVGLSAINPAAANTSLGAVPGFDAPQVFVTGLTTFQNGVNDQNGALYVWNSFQWYDDAFLTLGKHSLKFGGGVEDDQQNSGGLATQVGAFHFGSLSALLLNQPSSFSASLTPVPQRRFHYRESIFAGYIQDDIRWRRNLTINLGLRYETATVPTEASNPNKIVNLATPTSATAVIGGPIFANPTHRNFEPRVGFAWDPFGNGKTSVRSGFGMYDIEPLLYEFIITGTGGYPFAVSGASSSAAALAGTFPAGAVAASVANKLQGTHFIDPHPHRNYVMQWNLSIQREIANGLTATATYVGSRGVHNEFIADAMNMVLPTVTPAGYLWPKSGGTVLNPNWSTIAPVLWGNNSFYDGLLTEVTKRLAHGLQFQGSYTWSKSIDGASGSGLGDPFSNSISNLFYFENGFNRSLADFDVRQNVVVNSSWTLPTPALNNQVAKWAVGGWQLGGILSARTGLPFTVLIGGDPLGTLSSSPVDFPSRLTGAGCASAVNSGNPKDYINLSCFGLPMATAAIAAQCNPFSAATVPGTCANLQGNSKRNSLIGPGLVDVDFSVSKNNYFGRAERFNAQFRVETFNILNRSNFNSPTDNETLFDVTGAPVGGAGFIDATSTTARQIQFALKLIW